MFRFFTGPGAIVRLACLSVLLLVFFIGCQSDDDEDSSSDDDVATDDDTVDDDDNVTDDDNDDDILDDDETPDDDTIPDDDTTPDDDTIDDDVVDLGTATVTPDEVQATANERFVVEYTAETPIQPGGEIKVYFGQPYIHMDCHMTADPTAVCGAIKAISSNSDVELELSAVEDEPHAGSRLGQATIKVTKAALQTGETITLTYGANAGKAYVQEIAHDVEVTVLVQPSVVSELREIADSPMLHVLPLEPHKLISAVKMNEGKLKLAVVDFYANPIFDFDAEATMTLIAESGAQTSLGNVTMIDGVGEAQLPTVTPGYYVIQTQIAEPALISRVPFVPGGRSVYFGDIHNHTKLSDTYVAIDPLDSYDYAFNTVLLDFANITDHAEDLAQNQLYIQFLHRDFDNSWDETQRINEMYLENGFITLNSYEVTINNVFTARSGHNNVYFHDEGGKLFPFYMPESGEETVRNLTELWEKLDEYNYDAMTINHHSLKAGILGSDFAVYNPDRWRVQEIWSHHGCSESPDCPNTLWVPEDDPDAMGSVQRAIGPLGYRFGFIGGSDNHSGHPSGAGLKDPFYYHEGHTINGGATGGLAAVLVDDLTRDSLWTTIYNRHVYATSGARIYLEFSYDGQEMGSETVFDSEVRFDARAVGTAELAEVIVFKYSAAKGWEELYQATPANLFWDDEVVDDEYTQDSVYYLRVEQNDGYLAWSSPIWVDQE